MGELLIFPRSRIVREVGMSKRALAFEIGFSTRWIELRQKEDGLPIHRDANGRARYFLSEVRPWLDAWLDRRSA